MDTERTDREAQPPQPAQPKAATLRERVRRLWPTRGGRPRSSDGDWEASLASVEARVAHLEAALEGLQDSVYRQALREEESIDELRKRTEPGQIAQELSRDARKRGL